MRNYILPAIFIILCTTSIFSQNWTNIWSSGPVPGTSYSGYFDFQKNGNKWEERLYILDTVQFQVMQAGFTLTPQYTYTFNAAEKLAGNQIYSLSQDLTGDNITEFYVLAYYGTSTDYRQAFKIVDITTGNTVFEKNDPSFYYSYPSIYDINADGILECVFVKSNYPYTNVYYYEVYSTGISGDIDNQNPVEFHLMQNFPNPFNPQTEIRFELQSAGDVSVEIFNMQGEVVKTYREGQLPAGSHRVTWNGTDEKSLRQPSGIYFYRLSVNGKADVRKMILLR